MAHRRRLVRNLAAATERAFRSLTSEDQPATTTATVAVLLKVDYLNPQRPVVHGLVSDGENVLIDVFEKNITVVRLRISDVSGVSKPYAVLWEAQDVVDPIGGVSHVNLASTGESVTLHLLSTSTVSVSISRDSAWTIGRGVVGNLAHASSLGLLGALGSSSIAGVLSGVTSSGATDSTGSRIVFRAELHAHPAFELKLRAPEPREVLPAPPAMVRRKIDPSSGDVVLDPNNRLSFRAQVRGLEGSESPSGLVMRLEQVDGAHAVERSFGYLAPRATRSMRLGLLPAGRFRWQARAIWRAWGAPAAYTLKSDWVVPEACTDRCILVAPIKFSSRRRPPIVPMRLLAGRSSGYSASGPISLRASSWHPNDLPLKMVFQVLPIGIEWPDGTRAALNRSPDSRHKPRQRTTRVLKRNLRDYTTVLVSAVTSFALQPGTYRWRVRAVDENLKSAWAHGPTFEVLLGAEPPLIGRSAVRERALAERVASGRLRSGNRDDPSF